jgi:hypothetical protein
MMGDDVLVYNQKDYKSNDLWVDGGTTGSLNISDNNNNGNVMLSLPSHWSTFSFKEKMDWLFNNNTFTDSDMVEYKLDKLDL